MAFFAKKGINAMNTPDPICVVITPTPNEAGETSKATELLKARATIANQTASEYLAGLLTRKLGGVFTVKAA